MFAYVRLTLFVFIALAITACGGGGSSDVVSENSPDNSVVKLPEHTLPAYTDVSGGQLPENTLPAYANLSVGLPPYPNN